MLYLVKREQERKKLAWVLSPLIMAIPIALYSSHFFPIMLLVGYVLSLLPAFFIFAFLDEFERKGTLTLTRVLVTGTIIGSFYLIFGLIMNARSEFNRIFNHVARTGELPFDISQPGSLVHSEWSFYAIGLIFAVSGFFMTLSYVLIVFRIERQGS